MYLFLFQFCFLNCIGSKQLLNYHNLKLLIIVSRYKNIIVHFNFRLIYDSSFKIDTWVFRKINPPPPYHSQKNIYNFDPRDQTLISSLQMNKITKRDVKIEKWETNISLHIKQSDFFIIVDLSMRMMAAHLNCLCYRECENLNGWFWR